MFFMNCQRRWIGTTPDMQTKFMLLFFNLKCLPFFLTWQVSLTCKRDINQQTIKCLTCPCQEDAWYSRSFMYEEMQELALNVLHELSKKMARNNTWYANQIHASFLLAINACHFLWLDKFHVDVRASTTVKLTIDILAELWL